jgi:vacuolar-type H+-ATPase subunit E/Vma4
MKKVQIRQLAQSIIACGGIGDDGLKWVFDNFKRNDLKSFLYFLSKGIKDNTVTAYFAGDISASAKSKIVSLFPNKEITYKRDDESVGAGIRLEYGDFVADYSVCAIVKRILSRIRESI